MSYKIMDFPHCCTSKLFYDFGESITAEGGSRKVDYKEELKTVVRLINYHINFRQLACLTAITNNEQKTANKIFRRLGFKHSPWMTKSAHKNTKIRIWWLQLDKIQEDLDPRDYLK